MHAHHEYVTLARAGSAHCVARIARHVLRRCAALQPRRPGTGRAVCGREALGSDTRLCSTPNCARQQNEVTRINVSGHKVSGATIARWKRHAPRRLLPLRRSQVPPEIRFARSIHALPLLHLPQDRWRGRLRHQPRRRRENDEGKRPEKHQPLPGVAPRKRPTHQALESMAAFLQKVRQRALAMGSALAELIHPHASAIDTPLPKPPEVVEAALAYKANWVDVPKGKGHVHCREWPEESLQEWHQRHRTPA